MSNIYLISLFKALNTQLLYIHVTLIYEIHVQCITYTHDIYFKRSPFSATINVDICYYVINFPLVPIYLATIKAFYILSKKKETYLVNLKHVSLIK